MPRNPADRPATEPFDPYQPTGLAPSDDPNRCRQVAGRCERLQHDDDAHYTTYRDSVWTWALDRAANEGRNVLPDATDDQAAVIESWAEAAQGAAPRAEGLDVERLARAIKAVRRQQDHEAGRRKGYSDNYFDPEAAALAAEYASLSRPSDERVPESEERA